MKKKFEKELPEGYELVYHISATERRTAIKFNLVALVIMIGTFLLGLIPLLIKGGIEYALGQTETVITLLIFFAAMILYVIAHELVHGIAYKAMTGQRLTFGLTLSCAFCGVPSIYTYRRVALIALLAPFTVFTVLFLGLSIGLFAVHPLYYLCALWLLAMHVGGCVGDLYMSWLCFTRFRSRDILIRDTGPEQFIYSRTPKD